MKSTPEEVKTRLIDGPSLHYNWTGWGFITEFLANHGVDMSSFSGSNDGQLIPRNICMQVAHVLEDHLHELEPADQAWLKEHIESWRWARNFKQY